MYLRLTKHMFMHISLPLLAIFSLFSQNGENFLRIFFFAVLHELCHLVVAFFSGVPAKRFVLLPYGCELRLGRADFLAESKIAVAGPLGSLFFFFLLANPADKEINLMLFLVNLIPSLPLDGGKILRPILWRFFGVYRGNRLLRFFGISASAAFCFFGFSLPSVFCFFLAGLLFFHAAFMPSPLPLLQKKVPRPFVKIHKVHSRDSLHILNRLYSPFYTLSFYIKDKHLYVSEREVLRALKKNNAFTFAELLRDRGKCSA